MNTREAAKLISDDFASEARSHIKEVVLLDGDYIEFPVVATNTAPLKVTVVWSDLPSEVPTFSVDPTNLTLINDLDLRVIDPSGSTTNYPWILDPSSPTNAATTGDNFRDNVEQVYIASPTSGEYTVLVNHEGTLSNGFQSVSILISGNVAQPKPTFKLADLSIATAPTNVVTWSSLVGELYRVQTTEALTGSWSDVSGDISATKTNVAYPIPTNSLPDARFYRALEVD